jgi:hypothetical protein
LVTRRVPMKGFTMYPTSILLSQVQRSARTHYQFSDEMSETSNVSPDFHGGTVGSRRSSTREITQHTWN